MYKLGDNKLQLSIKLQDILLHAIYFSIRNVKSAKPKHKLIHLRKLINNIETYLNGVETFMDKLQKYYEDITNQLNNRKTDTPNGTDYSKPIDEFPISNRAKNALNSAGINTLQDLVEFSNSRYFYGIKGIGKETIKEIEKIFRAAGLEFTQ